ncbi:MAG: hypothetical protein FJ128_08020 [Deltaproteobacteria bacterium]|nr:hypothetical protein [Deltaproteobacteria bacterium]
MQLRELLTQKQAPILSRWRQLVFDSYPAQTAVFLAKEQDRFSNPVGYRLSQGLKTLFEALVHGGDRERVEAGLDEILGVKAVQELAPSQSLAFIFLLKTVVRQELAQELQDSRVAGEFREFGDILDGVVLLGFDIYTRRRERLCEIRVEEVKQRVSGLLRKAGYDLTNL